MDEITFSIIKSDLQSNHILVTRASLKHRRTSTTKLYCCFPVCRVARASTNAQETSSLRSQIWECMSRSNGVENVSERQPSLIKWSIKFRSLICSFSFCILNQYLSGVVQIEGVYANSGALRYDKEEEFKFVVS